MNTKDKGDFSEAKALFEFQKYNIPVCIPWGDNQRYDMIAEFNGKLQKIQVKTANEIVDKAIICYSSSSTNHTTNRNLTTYENEIDYFVFYNQPNDLVALVPISVFNGQKQKRFRMDKTEKQRQNSSVYFSDYSFDKTLCVETLHDAPDHSDEGEDKVQTTK